MRLSRFAVALGVGAALSITLGGCAAQPSPDPLSRAMEQCVDLGTYKQDDHAERTCEKVLAHFGKETFIKTYTPETVAKAKKAYDDTRSANQGG